MSEGPKGDPDNHLIFKRAFHKIPPESVLIPTPGHYIEIQKGACVQNLSSYINFGINPKVKNRIHLNGFSRQSHFRLSHSTPTTYTVFHRENYKKRIP